MHLLGEIFLSIAGSWTRKGKSEQPHMNRDKRCHDRLSITIFPDVGNKILLSVSRANTRSSTRATPLTLREQAYGMILPQLSLTYPRNLSFIIGGDKPDAYGVFPRALFILFLFSPSFICIFPFLCTSLDMHKGENKKRIKKQKKMKKKRSQALCRGFL